MKQIIIITTLLLMSLSVVAFAGNLDGTAGISLSQGVEGSYFANAATAATDFVMSTAHTQGTYAYATGSFTTSIWRSAEFETYASTELLSVSGTTYNAASIFEGFTELK